LEQTGHAATWTQWDAADPSIPDHAKGFGSPTILVNGKDVAGSSPSNNPECCRLYFGEDGLNGTVSLETINNAVRSAHRKRGVWSPLAAMPAAIVGFLPSATCPACWPVYAGLLSALGLGFLMDSRYLLPTLTILLAVALASLAFSGRTRGSYGPFGLGLSGALVLLAGKFLLTIDAVVYLGIGLLIAASIWNALTPAKRTNGTRGTCCSTENTEVTKDTQ
jgi:hypothetical protein